MRDIDLMRLSETMIEREYESHWLNETMKDTEWMRL